MIDNELIQLIVVGIIVAIAGTWLIVRMLRSIKHRNRRGHGCAGCSISEICTKHPDISDPASCSDKTGR